MIFSENGEGEIYAEKKVYVCKWVKKKAWKFIDVLVGP